MSFCHGQAIYRVLGTKGEENRQGPALGSHTWWREQSADSTEPRDGSPRQGGRPKEGAVGQGTKCQPGASQAEKGPAGWPRSSQEQERGQRPGDGTCSLVGGTEASVLGRSEQDLGEETWRAEASPVVHAAQHEGACQA